MKQFKVPLLVITFSLLMVGMAFAIDLPSLTTWNIGTLAAPVLVPGLTVTGVGGGGPGRGDVLLGPLYDCRNLSDPNLPAPQNSAVQSQFTLLAIVNTDPVNGVIGRLRFREWKRSWEVLDLDIPLTSNDVWVGQVSRATNGGCVLTSPDQYINNIPGTVAAVFTTSAFPAAGFPFNPVLITDGDTNPIARTEYGHFEFIGEEIFTSGISAGGTINRIAAGFSRDVGNTLEGTTFIVRPDQAISHQYNMTAIANFSITAAGIYFFPTSAAPSLFGQVQGGPDPNAAIHNVGAGGFDNLEALLSKRFLDFQYSAGVDPTDPTKTPMSTSVVVTFPTKFFHYDHTQGGVYPFVGVYPFQAPFSGSRETLGDELRSTTVPPVGALTTQDVGDVVGCWIWDRSEHLLTPPQQPISPGTSSVCRLPFEVNVVGLVPSATPTAAFRNNIGLATANNNGTIFYEGWGRIDLSPPIGDPSAGGGSDTRVNGREGKGGFARSAVLAPLISFNFYNNFFTGYRGLPAIGVVMTEFFNDSVLGYYGNTVPWQYGVDWAKDASILANFDASENNLP